MDSYPASFRQEGTSRAMVNHTIQMSLDMSLPDDIFSLLRQEYITNSPEHPDHIQDELQAILKSLTLSDDHSTTRLEALSDACYQLLSTKTSSSLHTRRLYTDIAILLALRTRAIERLDEAIVFSGAPGRLEIVWQLIEYIQTTHLSNSKVNHPIQSLATNNAPVRIPRASKEIPRIAEPDLLTFLNHASKAPFIIPGGIQHWPALNEQPWNSWEYLLGVAGVGRVVPVEVGADYRVDSWSQTMMPWETFLDTISKPDGPVVYLAQHSLFNQFPKLREDIIVPDLVYFSPETSVENYRPPTNDEGVIMNAWFGPAGTISPAHQDPFFNCYAQVIGRKTIWLASPRFHMEMYPLSSGSQLSNTTSLDVFSDTIDVSFPLFQQQVVNEAMYATLEPGDLLYFPPGWWHAMRSEDTSFSVSFWF